MADTTITIPRVELERLEVTIEGATPLITHRFGERARAKIEDDQQKRAKGAKGARVPEEEFRDALYIIPGQPERYGVPGAALKKALVTAGGRFTDEHMTTLRGVINVMGDLLEIQGGAPVMRADMVRLNGRVSSIAYRPMFDPWSIVVPVVYNTAMIRDEQILNLFQIAGFSVGIGDWRPEKNGTFGQFVVREANVVRATRAA